jgi:hypothetical protein
MSSTGSRISFPLAFFLLTLALAAPAQDSASSSSSNSRKSTIARSASLQPGSVSNGVYRNPWFGFTCKIPAGWVLRTDEMNEHDDSANSDDKRAQPSATPGRVLLAAFSRPPLAHGEDVNSSILIAAESAAAYPGLKDPAQYFGPIDEITKAQGFDVDEDPYEFAVGTKTLVRGDFEKDVGSRVMHQSTLVMFARGYAVSFTFIGGTEDEVEELVSGLTFSSRGNTTK